MLHNCHPVLSCIRVLPLLSCVHVLPLLGVSIDYLAPDRWLTPWWRVFWRAFVARPG